MTLAVLIEFLKAAPVLIRLVANVWDYLFRISKGRPEQLVAELTKISEDLKNAETKEDKTDVARRISLLWAGELPDKKTKAD